MTHSQTMNCYVYKGTLKDDYYLYLDHEFDEGDILPDPILKIMGSLSLILEFELNEEKYLQQADASQVMSDIGSQGFYLQMPKKDMSALEDAYFS